MEVIITDGNEMMTMETFIAHCPEIHCTGCVASIVRSLGKLPGVEMVRVDLDNQDVRVEYAAERISLAVVRERLIAAGFPPAN